MNALGRVNGRMANLVEPKGMELNRDYKNMEQLKWDSKNVPNGIYSNMDVMNGMQPGRRMNEWIDPMNGTKARFECNEARME